MSLDYYSRRDVQKALLAVAEDREVSARFGQGFGKRPDVLEFPGDVLEMAKRGATSFHVSEERWFDVFDLKPGMPKREMDSNRKGWDLILDIDTPHWDYARWTTYYLIEALKSYGIKSIFLKFSGSKGFHIGVPFESFPDEVKGMKIRELFPEAPKVITLYLENMIKSHLSKKILEGTDVEKISKKCEKTVDELMKDGEFNPFVLVDIDTILISSRHLFRAPYSMHEKLGLVSVPIDIEKCLEFKKEDAEPSKVRCDKGFLVREGVDRGEARGLIIQAYDDWYSKSKKNIYLEGHEEVKEKGNFEVPKEAVLEEFFPACITNILNKGMEDGKKRSLFILINFLRSVGWSWVMVRERIDEWNKLNPQSLREVYINAQIAWNKKLGKDILPPNCANKAYYKDLLICCDDDSCKNYKNPVNFALRRSRAAKKYGKKKKMKEVKKNESNKRN